MSKKNLSERDVCPGIASASDQVAHVGIGEQATEATHVAGVASTECASDNVAEPSGGE